MTDLIELAKQQAAEIACAGHNGWGNTMLELAAALEALRAEREVICAEAVKYADKSGRLEAKVDRLAEALQLARDLVEDWAVYASEYFQKKHNLEGDLALLDDALRDHEQEVGDGRARCALTPELSRAEAASG